MAERNQLNEQNDFDDGDRHRIMGELECELNLPRQGRSLCLLVVADMDLPSASTLAEAALRELPKGGTLVDGILACGPFVTPDSLRPYLQQQHDDELSPTSRMMSPELSCALEGLVTGCLSQLESIACRVMWIPSTDRDPSTLWSHNGNSNPFPGNAHSSHRRGLDERLGLDDGEKRLTPNSRNIHRQSLPLAPGLSCCGLAIGSAERPFDLPTYASLSHMEMSASDVFATMAQDEILQEALQTVSNLLDLSSSSIEDGDKSRNETPNYNYDNDNVRLSSVPAIIVATSCHDTTSNGMFLQSHYHEILLQEEHRLLLHVCALRRDPMEEPRLEGKKTLYPGSLRERGEYCLVHLEVVPEDSNEFEGKTSTSSLFRWQVSSVDFRRVGDMAYTTTSRS